MHGLRIASGALVWALHFAIIYGFTGLACARGFGESAPWVVGAATVAGAALAAVLVVRNLASDFYRWMTAAVGGAALVAILWEGLVAFMVPTCA